MKVKTDANAAWGFITGAGEQNQNSVKKMISKKKG